MPARLLNVMLGVWLFVSAFAWPHTSASRANTGAASVAIVLVSLASMAAPGVRYANALLGAWMVASPFLIVDNDATLWNNGLVGLAVFIGAFCRPLVPRRREAPAH